MSVAPWSFSKIKAFEKCPRQFYHLKVVKDYKEPETEAMLYGTDFHEACELYIRDGKDLPGRFEFARPMLEAIKAKPGEKLCEYELGLTEDLEPCGFKDENVWFRGIADLIVLNGDTAWVIDYKTGRNTRYADTGQLELMALAVFQHFPDVEKVRGGLLFAIAKKMIKGSYDREKEPELWAKWLGDFKRMEKAFELDVWNANPSGLCRRHCVVLECPHNGGK
jgi:hypothetical protein